MQMSCCLIASEWRKVGGCVDRRRKGGRVTRGEAGKREVRSEGDPVSQLFSFVRLGSV